MRIISSADGFEEEILYSCSNFIPNPFWEHKRKRTNKGIKQRIDSWKVRPDISSKKIKAKKQRWEEEKNRGMILMIDNI